MRQDEVPHEKKQFRDGHLAPPKVLYVTNADGQYTQASCEGWEAENIVLEQVWDDLAEQLVEAYDEYRKGLCSPLKFYMIRHRMDIPLLASYVGKWSWQVRRHLTPSGFASLKPALLEKYAGIFSLTVDQLKQPSPPASRA